MVAIRYVAADHMYPIAVGALVKIVVPVLLRFASHVVHHPGQYCYLMPGIGPDTAHFVPARAAAVIVFQEKLVDQKDAHKEGAGIFQFV